MKTNYPLIAAVRKAALIFTGLYTLCSLNANAQWTQTTGPVGGTVNCLTTDGTSLYAGIQGSGVFYSANSGANWTQVINGLNSTNITALTMTGSTVYAGGSGVYMSTNNGSSWTNLNNGIPAYENIMSMASNGSTIFAGTNGDGVYRSLDGGATWALSNSGLPASEQIYSLAINGNNIFAGTGVDGVYLSTNNGATWSAVNTGLTYTNQQVHAIAVKGSSVFCSINNNGVFMTTNNGTSWSAANSGLPNNFVNSFLVNGTDLFAATDNNGVYKSTNNGTSWSAANVGILNTRTFSLAIMGATIFAGTWGTAVYATTNNGTSWLSSSVGLIATNANALAFNGSNLFAGVYGTGLSISSSGGAVWSPLSNPLIYNGYTSFAVGSGNVFASTYGEGVYLSTNNGATWSAVNNTLSTTGQAMYVNALAISGTTIFAGAAQDGAFVSTNNGTTWTQVNTGLTNHYMHALAVNGSNVFAGTDGGVFLSTNNGASWTAVNTGLTNIYITSLFVNGSNIFAGTNGGGVFMSGNNGTSWTSVSTGLPSGYNFTSFAASGSNIFVTTSGAVFLTTNNGASWSNVSDNLPYLNFNALATNGNSIYIGSNGEGVWKRQIPEIICSLNPPVMTSTSSASICSGSAVNIPLTNSGVAANFSWLASDNSQTTGESTTAQTTGTINNTLINTSNSSSTVVSYTVTPTGISGGCTGTPEVINVTVNPLPVMTSNSTLTICSGQSVGLALTSTVASTYNWIAANNPNTTGESTTAQSAGTINDVLINTSLVPQTVTYTITPTSTTGSCAGIPQALTVTVNPTPTMTSASSASICSGSTVNINLTSNVAASYVWIAANNPNTTGESTTFQSTSALSNTVVNNTLTSQTVTYTITPTAVVGGCAGSQIFTLTVKPTPNMTSASSASICSNGTATINLGSDIASSYVWNATSDNPNTSGESLTPQTTNTLTATITNNSTIVQVVYYTVVPTSSVGGCAGAPQSVAITVKPVPTMTSTSATTICSGGTVSIPLSSSITSTYTWIAADNTNTTGESLTSQTTTILSNTITNTSNTAQDVIYTVIPTATIGGCVGASQTVTVTVNPTPAMTSASAATICSGNAVNITLGSNVLSNFSWSAANNVNTTGESTTLQSGNVLNNTITNNSAIPQDVIYTVTPTSVAGNCAGIPQTVTVTVNPEPVIISSTGATICSGNTVNLPFVTNVNSTFVWVATDNANTTGESLTPQTTNSLINTITNNSTFVQSVLYSVTPTSVAGGCVGGTQTVSVIVNPLDNAGFSYSASSYCKTAANPSSIITGVTGGTFSSTSGLVFANIYNGLIDLSASAVGTYTVTYTTGNTCSNTSTRSITITPAPSASFSYSGSPYCSSAANPLPVFGSGATAGVFSASPTGLSFVSTTTGQVNLAASIPGTYTITNYIAAAGGCASEQASYTITINPLPVVNFSGLAANYYYNDPAVTLTGSPAGGTFSGTSVTGNTFRPSVAGAGTFTITYTFTDNNGCTNTSSKTTTIVAQPAAPSICEVTVDAAGINNEIYWDKTQYSKVDSFIVYRETGAGYQRIGAVADSALSMFVDTVRFKYFPNTGNPNAGTYRYKIQIRDSAGHYSPLSPYHNTIYFNKSFGTFTWNAYQIEGQPVPLPGLITYDLWRDDSTTGAWHQVNSVTGSQLTQTDIGWSAALEQKASWRVMTNWTIGCTPTRATINTTRSNIKNAAATTGPSGVNENNLNLSVSIYPNPASDNVTIAIADFKAKASIKLYNLVGEVVYQTEVNTANSTIDVSSFAQGIYTVGIESNGNMVFKKFVKN